MQLVAYGKQDIYLTSKPEITFWKSVYRRCTNFAIESIVQDYRITPEYGNETNFVLTRDGDCLLYTSPSPRDLSTSRMPSSA